MTDFSPYVQIVQDWLAEKDISTYEELLAYLQHVHAEGFPDTTGMTKQEVLWWAARVEFGERIVAEVQALL